MFREFAIALVEEAGVVAKRNFMLGMAREWKEDATPVTATDLAINALVIERVKKHFPDHAILGEEESGE